MTLIASHRGGSHLWPENSRLAFRQTAAMAVDMVEFDVHQTRDVVLVVHHDASIDRMTDGKGAIGAFSYDELQRHVIIGTGGETIPTLAETIAIFEPSPVDLRLELKSWGDGRPYGGMTDRVVSELAAAGMVERTLVTSFQLERLRDFHGALERQGLRAAQLIGSMWLCSPQVVSQCGLGGIVAMLRDSGVSEIGLKLDAIDEESLKYLRNDGFKVHGWAAHTIEAARTAFALELASFTTDRPDLALLARSERVGSVSH